MRSLYCFENFHDDFAALVVVVVVEVVVLVGFALVDAGLAAVVMEVFDFGKIAVVDGVLEVEYVVNGCAVVVVVVVVVVFVVLFVVANAVVAAVYVNDDFGSIAVLAAVVDGEDLGRAVTLWEWR